MSVRIVATRIIPGLVLMMFVRIAAARIIPALRLIMTLRMAAARIIPALGGILYDLRNGWLLPGSFLR